MTVSAPVKLMPNPPERDDNPVAVPAAYTLQHLRFSVSSGSRFDPANPPPPRVYEGYLAAPTAGPPPYAIEPWARDPLVCPQ